ncbi:type II toxin-antitoxin system RelE/ParE family toxin [Candidatus Pacearchaeota archaeon CG10_big_fil_rev_8_21_14_0_10_31_24]|nr:MAG: type II toxin-antitoxin system RelE/ParE family toxin [Candidatus Pacearchaeota archaeon CG10_big_fil_rev_8_21_14_0_10_31_24]
MTYKIIPTMEFERDFKKVDKFFQKILKKKVEEVAENPERYKHLHYEFKGSCRIRIGKLRVIYSYDVQKQELYMEQIVFSHKY